MSEKKWKKTKWQQYANLLCSRNHLCVVKIVAEIYSAKWNDWRSIYFSKRSTFSRPRTNSNVTNAERKAILTLLRTIALITRQAVCHTPFVFAIQTAKTHLRLNVWKTCYHQKWGYKRQHFPTEVRLLERVWIRSYSLNISRISTVNKLHLLLA